MTTHEPDTDNPPGFIARHERKFLFAMIALFSVLLVWSVLAWAGVISEGRYYDPGPSALLNIAILMQLVAQLIQESHRRTFYALLAVSAVLTIASVATMR